MLKLSPRVAGETDELGDEATALALWVDVGVGPRVHGVRDDGLTILMERIRPGLNLRQTGADALEIVTTLGRLCRRIHVTPPPGRFRALPDAADIPSWRRGLAGTREADELVRLLVPRADDRLLHIDLHWLNALQGPGSWLAIDPRPVIGDPHADVFAFFDGPPIDTVPAGHAAAREHAQRLITAYADAAKLDVDRVSAWVRIRALIFASELADEDGEEDDDRIRRKQLLRLADAVT